MVSSVELDLAAADEVADADLVAADPTRDRRRDLREFEGLALRAA